MSGTLPVIHVSIVCAKHVSTCTLCITVHLFACRLCCQAGEDVSRLSSLQEQVLSLSQQVQLLQPLQPKLSTAEAERDAAMHKLERLQVCLDC